MRPRDWLLVPVSALLVSCLACGGGSGGLRGASYDIPVYPQAKVTERDTGGFSAGDSFSSLDSFDYVAWTLTTRASMGDVVDFYKAKFPREVARGLEDSYDPDEEVVVNFKAPGMGPEDYVELSIMPGEISIMQITRR